MALVYSTTKGLAAMTLAVAHARGWLDYEERVCAYWPEFAQQGKVAITVRQLLAHQAGLFAFEEQADRTVVADSDRLAVVLARQKPACVVLKHSRSGLKGAVDHHRAARESRTCVPKEGRDVNRPRASTEENIVVVRPGGEISVEGSALRD